MHKSKLILGALVVVGTVFGTVGTTHADPPGGSGWDENPDVVVGGGSDTTYLMAQRTRGPVQHGTRLHHRPRGGSRQG